MRIIVSGSSGLIGQEICRRLRDRGDEVIPLTRTPQPGAVVWDPTHRTIDKSRFEGVDAVIHLAGEPILGRWSDEKKAKIRDSRILGTRLLAETLASLKNSPAVFVSTSAIGIYGNTFDIPADEDYPGPRVGSDFLVDVGTEWEAATAPAATGGVRVAIARIGIVLATEGGALAAMLPPFRFGVGGPVGTGQQWMSWVTRNDVARAFLFLLDHEKCQGPYNVVAPHPATNAEFSKALGNALHRPAVLPVPAFAVKLLYGSECATATVLASIRARPTRIQEAGFSFEDPDLGPALKRILH